jgi:hypothetical protein
MDIVAKFLDHADECRRMARFTRDLQTKIVWNRMAERWLMLAAREKTRNKHLSEMRALRTQALKSRAA